MPAGQWNSPLDPTASVSQASVFFDLHPHLQHAIVHELGWRSLRPVQEQSARDILRGDNCVILAPTAGGKTEAAIFPILSEVLRRQAQGVFCLYICPIRALLNNQEPRLERYAKMVGLEVFKWHGDVPSSARKRMLKQPPAILMTTPESLEVMLMSPTIKAEALFAQLAVAIIDEVHAFAGDDRGAHLMSILERLRRFCDRDVQRIGLSATVGNPAQIGQWLQGSSERRLSLVDPPRPLAKRELFIDYTDSSAELADLTASWAFGKKSLVFVESRSKAEKVARAMSGRGLEVFIHHGSISREDRQRAEQKFTSGHNTAIVCTSTMELGIDVGDLDHVIQIDAASSVASMLQRMGRTGRRAGSTPNCSFFCESPEALIQAVALCRLAEAGWVEPVRPSGHAMHVLAHQIIALTLQEGGVSRYELLPWVQAAYPFCTVREEQLLDLVDTMLERQILYESEGLLSLGVRGEKLYGRKNFFELYAVFTAPPVMKVVHNRSTIGFLQSQFIQFNTQEDVPMRFLLSGRAWKVVDIEWSRSTVRVVPSRSGKAPSWMGQPSVLSFDLCQAMHDVLLVRGQESKWLSEPAAALLESLRQEYEGLLEAGTAPLEDAADQLIWHTFAGGGVNKLLAFALEQLTQEKWSAGNLTLSSKACGRAAAKAAILQLSGLDLEDLACAAATQMARGVISKFQPCLPEDAEDRLLAERLLDVPQALRFLNGVRVDGVRIGGAPSLEAHTIAQPSGASGGKAPRAPSRRLRDVIEVAAPAPKREPLSTLEPENPWRWVDTEDVLQDALRGFAAEPVLGLDVETGLDFGTLCLVQLASPTETLLIDPFAIGLTQLEELLAAQSPKKLIHNARFERRVLAQCGLRLEGVIDTMLRSRALHGADAFGGHSLAMVCERELGGQLDKRMQTSTWGRRPLSLEQLRYAALDAEILLRIYARWPDQK